MWKVEFTKPNQKTLKKRTKLSAQPILKTHMLLPAMLRIALQAGAPTNKTGCID